MKRKSNIFALVLVSVFSFLMLAIVNPGFAAGKVTELRLAIHTPPGSLVHKIVSTWKDKVEEVTEGQVKVTIYPSQSLVKLRDAYSGTVKGICDIAFSPLAMDASRFPLSFITEMPLMGWPAGVGPTRIWTELKEKYPDMQAEYKEVKTLWHYAALPMTLHFTKKKVRVPADIKGLKIEAAGFKSAAMKFYGASPMVLPPSEWYTALDRGIEDGMIHNYAVIFVLKVHTLLKHHVDVDFGLLSQAIVMNKKKWDSLPKDIQKKIDDIRPWIEEKSVEFSDALDKKIQKLCKDLDHTFYTPTPEEKQLWLKGAKSVQDAWIGENEAKGFPARAILDETKTLIKKYSQP
jgi:TRAP-type C4-dicarboxylate transport system substrate-binding protein